MGSRGGVKGDLRSPFLNPPHQTNFQKGLPGLPVDPQTPSVALQPTLIPHRPTSVKAPTLIPGQPTSVGLQRTLNPGQPTSIGLQTALIPGQPTLVTGQKRGPGQKSPFSNPPPPQRKKEFPMSPYATTHAMVLLPVRTSTRKPHANCHWAWGTIDGSHSNS